MSHIHLPDGVIPPAWWILGFVLCFALLWLFTGRIKGDELRRKIPFAGVIAALMLIFMSVPLGFLPVHLSLAVLCGILAGPGLSFIAIFVVNTILALMGHGGFTAIGINTLLMGGEAIAGYYLFKILSGRLSCTFSAILSNITALLLSTALMLILVASTAGLSEVLPFHDHGQNHGEEVHFAESKQEEELPENYDEHKAAEAEGVKFLSITGWSAVIMIILSGIFIESLLTGLIVNFFSKVRPDFLDIVHPT
ncbi:MAG: energy-coupling factor ABC transporter permease [Clostridia bacterium]|nr:energy-coupling factor ABC transporter permease [Clostridia bacterium]